MRTQKLTKLLDDGYTMYLTDKEDIRYYSGFTGEGRALISNDKKIILTDGRYITSAKRECEGFEIVNTTKYGEFFKENGIKIASIGFPYLIDSNCYGRFCVYMNKNDDIITNVYTNSETSEKKGFLIYVGDINNNENKIICAVCANIHYKIKPI